MIPILDARTARAWEESAFTRGLDRAALMAQAVGGCVQEIISRWPRPGTLLVLAGKGHNGNDALAIAARLRSAGWRIDAILTDPPSARARPPLAEIEPVASAAFLWPDRPFDSIPTGTLVLDGLLGLGTTGPARGRVRDLLCWLPRAVRGPVVRLALDGPSGLNPDTGEFDDAAFRADFTLALGSIKPGFLLDAASPCVGRIVAIPLPLLADTPIPAHDSSGEVWIDLDAARCLARPSPAHAFKHRRGQLGILAGSPGMTGAAVLAANAAVRAGCGLVRLWTRVPLEQPLPRLLPEVMRVAQPEMLLRQRSSALLIGPGLGHDEVIRDDLARFLVNVTAPAVLDADALNLLAFHPELWSNIQFPFVLTPHTGELQRLLGRPYAERKEAAFVGTERFGGTLVLKGPNTLVTARESGLTWNGSGNPGMAKGGMGDVLSGVIGTLLAQGYPTLDAARLGTFWHGLAGDLAATEHGEQAVHPEQVSQRLGRAAREIWLF